MTPLTAGLKCAPLTGASMVIITNRIAPVAMVLASSATATLPPLSASAITPEPITPANRKKLPTPSAASRRPSAGAASGGMLVHGLADPAELPLQAQFVDAVERQREEQ